MNTNSTEIKNEIVNEVTNSAEGVSPRTPLVACNSNNPLEAQSLPVSDSSAALGTLDIVGDQSEVKNPNSKMQEPSFKSQQAASDSKIQIPKSKVAPPRAPKLPTSPRRKSKPSRRPRVGKIAKLPPELRTFVNQQMLAEVGYPRIIEALTEKGFPGINATNLCKWKDGGFREWVLSQDTAAAQNARRAAALSLARDKGSTLEEATVQLALGSVYTVLENLDLVQWQADIGSKNDNVLNLFGGLLNLIKANKTLEPKKRSALNRQADLDSTPHLLKRGLTEEERDQVCQTLGIFPPDPEPKSEPNK